MQKNSADIKQYNWSKFFVTWFYVGLIPKAPGTFGTLAAIPIFLLFSKLSPVLYMGLVFGLILASIFLIDIYQKNKQGHDHQEIVIDEVIGYLVTLTWLPPTWQTVLFGFILFRALDILKPFPISHVDQKMKGGLGVVADDLVAGIIANIGLQFVYTYTTWLGQQLPNSI